MANASRATHDRVRVAICGGDERVSDLVWPQHIEVKHFPYKSNSSANKLLQSLKSGKVDMLIILTKYIGHSTYNSVKWADVPIVHWPKSPMSLSKEIDSICPIPDGWEPSKPAQKLVPVPVPHVEEPTQVKEVEERMATPATVEERVVQEDFSTVFKRLMESENLNQSGMAKKIGIAQATVSRIVRGLSTPSTFSGELIIKLSGAYPELGKFFGGTLKTLQPVTNNVIPFTPTYTTELMKRWRKAKEDFEEAKRNLEEIEMEMMTFPGL